MSELYSYFAYGSNMSPAKLQDWSIEARFVSAACLHDWTLKMNKRGKDGFARANIEPAPGCYVCGVLYEVDADALRKLDDMEGLGRGYRAEFLPVRIADGAQYQAYTYIGIKLAEGLSVTMTYRDMILQGAAEHGLPADYCAWLERQLAGAV